MIIGLALWSEMEAIISDIHANKEALEAVLHDIGNKGIDRIMCLGDIVGYGPDPKDCIDMVQQNCEFSLMGNHDWAVLNAPLGFNSVAARMVTCHKEWLEVTEQSTDRERERWEFLSSLVMRLTYGKFDMVHASPRAELTEYIMPMDVRYDTNKLTEIFQMIESYCIVGHTHVPFCITQEFELIVPEGTGWSLELGDRKMIINAGSVGQPRDGDNRACYIILDDGYVVYHRVPYYFDETAEKISALGPECEVLGYRLSIGR